MIGLHDYVHRCHIIVGYGDSVARRSESNAKGLDEVNIEGLEEHRLNSSAGPKKEQVLLLFVCVA